MSVLGMDIGFLTTIAGSILAVLGISVVLYEIEFGSSEKLMRAGWAATLCGLTAMLAIALNLGFRVGVGRTETVEEKGWELQETRELASLASLDAGGRMLEGSSSGNAWAMLGAGGGSSSSKLSSEPDAGTYLLVERQADGGLRKLAVNADETVIYEVDDERDCRAELYRATVTVTETLIEPNWWFPSADAKYADGPVTSVREDWRRAQEWRVYLPAGSVVTGSWDAGAGLDGEGVGEEER